MNSTKANDGNKCVRAEFAIENNVEPAKCLRNHSEAPESSVRNDIERGARFERHEFEPVVAAGEGDLNDKDYDMPNENDDVQAILAEVNME
ncbi:hypothetical protein GH714_010967 [Hevea brasiliensis]|uniref:Uncharacterized protein n=1 Tax=Hevea brasiliensis TaxID=3981 RepID=A0A6A6LGV6_HEVBR|nr:hypothetical protein GH714_010967 [Hevea brasiliensis]